jgi:hypothetical protein
MSRCRAWEAHEGASVPPKLLPCSTRPISLARPRWREGRIMKRSPPRPSCPPLPMPARTMPSAGGRPTQGLAIGCATSGTPPWRLGLVRPTPSATQRWQATEARVGPNARTTSSAFSFRGRCGERGVASKGLTKRARFGADCAERGAHDCPRLLGESLPTRSETSPSRPISIMHVCI